MMSTGSGRKEKSMKLNELIKTNNARVYGFDAFKGLEALSMKEGASIVISTLSPAIMNSMGIATYYAPVLSRGTVFNTTSDVYNADLDVQLINIFSYPSWDDVNTDKIIIVSRHKATIEILHNMYPNAPVFSDSVSKHDIDRAHVIGTLPPMLIQHCQSYRAVTIKDFDHSKDGCLSGQELNDRISISNPISVTVD